jgi:Tol biopolymer transport system component
VKLLAMTALVVASLHVQAARSNQPRLVGEGVISTPDDESGFAISADGKTAYFGKSSPSTAGEPARVILVTHLDASGRWMKPEIASFDGKYHDIGPALAPDGSRLYFLSDRPNGDSSKHDFNVWFVSWTGSAWSEARALAAPVNSDAQEYGVSIAANGTLYFASNRQGGKGSFDLYRSKLEDGQYKTVENLGESVNTKGPELQPAVSPDETILVFTAGGRDDELIGVHKEYTHGDLYVSVQKNGSWSTARNCGVPVNSGAAESWPSFSSDGRRFFFSSERGFATYRLRSRMTWSDIKRGLTSTLSGMGNIYELDASGLLSNR